jgi:hypothetical protein
MCDDDVGEDEERRKRGDHQTVSAVSSFDPELSGDAMNREHAARCSISVPTV